MFRNRNSQKPAGELYAAFKRNFPHVGMGTASSSSVATSGGTSTSLSTTTMEQAMDQSKEFSGIDNGRDAEVVVEDSDFLRFTPPVADDNSFNFSAFVHQQSTDFSTPTPGGLGYIFHNQAGDLHTPDVSFQLGTPISSEASHPISAIDLQGFNPHLLHSQPFLPTDNFHQQGSYAPSSFIHHDSGYETMDPTKTGIPSNSTVDHQQHQQEPPSALVGLHHSQAHVKDVSAQEFPLEKFRYHVTLNAPTAMIKQPDEIPITYLNKGQAYLVSISDSMGTAVATSPVRYRTVIRISFEDEQQRQRPAQCWQLWKEGRGLAEAHQRGGKLQAVEYVDPSQGGDMDSRRSRVELETSSFDCFSVIWSPAPGTPIPTCAVSVRFNFLSTDFSHSKGVKGIPVRLCAKTEIVSSGTPDSPPGPRSEVCFCKVKLFRDHGAERKLSNDIAHIKKTIDKLQQQIAQTENGIKENGKRKRSGSNAGKSGNTRPTKMAKHKRAWSVSSQGSGGHPAEDDLHIKLGSMQDMFSSTRPVSFLYLKGYEQDDPDAFPVNLPRESADGQSQAPSTQPKRPWDRKVSGASTPSNTAETPASSSYSGNADSRSKDPAMVLKSTIPQSAESREGPPHISETRTANLADPAAQDLKSLTDHTLPHWMNAFGVDRSYQAPPERPVKPVACFYVLIKIPGDTFDSDCYRAVYLMERTVKDLITNIALKCGVDPNQVTRTLRINARGLKIVVDDEVVRELLEGQDMVVEFKDLAPIKEEGSSEASTPKGNDKSIIPEQGVSSNPLEMRLVF